MATSGVPPVLTHAAGLPSDVPADYRPRPPAARGRLDREAELGVGLPGEHRHLAVRPRRGGRRVAHAVAPAGDAPHVQAPVTGFCVASASFPLAVTATSVTPPAPVTTAGVPVSPPGPVPAADHELHPEVPSVARSSAPDPVTQNTSSVRPPATTGTGAPAHPRRSAPTPSTRCSRRARTAGSSGPARWPWPRTPRQSPSGAWTAPGSLTGFPASAPTGPPHCQSFGAPGCCQACTTAPARSDREQRQPARPVGGHGRVAGQVAPANCRPPGYPDQAALPIGCW